MDKDKKAKDDHRKVPIIFEILGVGKGKGKGKRARSGWFCF
ncbi:hypothetical protein CCACVL1_18608 [Corchorus capsularis]|uniref:Uncharacterized protein n=1 Tax=Corchorus capsularis TaxID=210143 RepID=A0A1R3HKM3_COCAP|nr:hypothetical protein CCACVL1_18608 [Corchorus capsularis]